MTVTDEPRIGVFVCHCGHNIAGTVDVRRVATVSSQLPNVVFSTDEMFMCSDAGQQLIRDKVAELGLNRVVVASCSPRMHEPTFRRVCEESGINRYLFEQVNLREHVSWCHMREPELATQKAIDLVRMAVARARRLEPLPVKRVKIAPRALIVGGGISGLTAALDIADRGFEVVLVERDDHLGGNVMKWNHMYPGDKPGAEVAEPLISRVSSHNMIKVLLNTEVEALDGYVGNFDVTVKNKKDGGSSVLSVGTIILATGFKSFVPEGYYSYGASPDIMTLAEFQQLPVGETVPRPSTGKPATKVAFIGCVGSREPGVRGHEHCSRYCCSAVAKAAADTRGKTDEVLVLYQDIRTYGRGHEEFYRLAREKHVIYSRFPAAKKPEVSPEMSPRSSLRQNVEPSRIVSTGRLSPRCARSCP
ncbi:MAG: CoB--CoM heterodisulfide reductase iron-sulfur subunit A family protein, partial [Candidatus Thorarchaeota archaeon]|nr:CoB--CoM heterodisulfide reductase iron-sulfur subunit A family protein [Candidatus Thorarchaeota archaeon]